ncbi:MAG: tRNA-dihydrouridine synthase [Proteobacteria bacterium]|uniref:tRNA-dihydrouridine synthase n=1 Tax=Candidatus Avisuccinivibrio stercorigallinarum TaxID=2840704 RepID=A0A9D9GT51_9GAMM|nr:tRNA-dihydrouridine synthase [Candidatus Avisuccinivibrio stercorigallinarum]
MQAQKVYLAPMEGVCDPPLRQILCAIGGYDECFSEFIRVTDEVLPRKTLLREVPELKNDCRTPDGTPVRVQFLGDNAQMMAGSAKLAVELGARGIDLNFGCPSRFVHHAGSMLLKEPQLIHCIVAEVREALPPEIVLSVKMRLGFADIKEAPNLVQAAAVDGVNEIILHARTRKELYRKDALHWEEIALLHQYAHGIPLVANGDIIDKQSAVRCMELTGCDRLMTGRAALMEPNLGKMIKEGAAPLSFRVKLELVYTLMQTLEQYKFAEKSVLDRSKQYLGFVRKCDEQAAEFFKRFCHVSTKAEAVGLLEEELKSL